MTFSATGLPGFAALTDNGGGSGSVLLSPGFADSGTYQVSVVVVDNGSPSLSDTKAVTVTVTNTNRAPQLAAITNQIVTEGNVVNVPLSATDADGETITLSRTAGPAFATVTNNGNGTGTLRLAPTSADSGVYALTIRATDSGNPSAFAEASLSVSVIDTTANQVALENQLPGTNQWRLGIPAGSPAELRQIEGYASATSVNRGSTISLYVNTAAATFQLEVFRMGWYQGLGARRVFGPVQVTGRVQTVPSPDPSTGLVDANWTNPYVLDTETGGEPWRTGVYLAKLTTEPVGKQSYIIFVVRDDAHTPDVLFSLPVTTYQAYNAWGGRSLYPTQSGNQQPWGSTSGVRAVKVSFNRPYAASVSGAAWYGMGAGEFITNTQPVSPADSNYPISASGWDYNLVRWLEQEQYDVGYVTNIDVHRTNANFTGIQVFLSPGHDEYWSWQMFDNIEGARASGIDLAFLSANTAYRQIRFESSPNSAGSPEQAQRRIAHYREVPDPILSDGNSSNDYLVTTEFRDSPNPGRPEQGLLGVQYVEEGGHPVDANIVITNAGHAVFAGTGLNNGSSLVGLLGYEVDRRYTAFGGNVVELASSPYTTIGTGLANNSHMSLSTPGGGQVFATGSIQWSWGLDDFNGPGQGGLRTARLSAAAQQLTDNVLQRFGATPYVPDPIRAQCVQLRALSNSSGNPSWASAAEIDLLGPDGRELPKNGWVIVADSEEASTNPATNAIDGIVTTFWHSNLSGGSPPLPHTLTINLGSAIDVSALRYLPRQDGSLNGTISMYEVNTSPTCATPTWTRATSGNWLETPTANAGRKTARFLR
jgi:hypothetical protein